MQEHYQFTDQEMKTLEAKGVTIADLFYAVKDFKIEEAAPSKISLYHYIDTHGDFLESKRKGDIIAMVIFEKLEIQDKLAVAEYIEFIEEGEEDE